MGLDLSLTSTLWMSRDPSFNE